MADTGSNRRLQFLPQEQISLTHIGTIALVGALVGIATWLLSLLIQAAVIQPLFCRTPETFSVCGNGGTVSFTIAAVLAHIAGLYALVRLNAYRPLLIVLATIVTLWGIQVWLGNLAWYEATLLYSLVVAISYALFGWLSRIVSFGLTLAAIFVIIVLSRIFLNLL